jgi:hypothetical protein
MAETGKIASLQQFQNDPKLQAEFGGDYGRYLDSFLQKLNNNGLFSFAQQGYTTVPGLNQVSLFYNFQPQTTGATDKIKQQEEEKQAKIDKKLETIKDPKIRAQVAAELYSNNLTEEFFELLLDRYEKKKEEFDVLWAKYQAAKGEAANMKKVCERLLREYQSKQDISIRTNYINAEHKFSDADMWAGIFLSEAGDVAHRA